MSMSTELQIANKILAALPPEEFEPLADKLKPVPLVLGEILYMPSNKSNTFILLTAA